MKTNVWNINRNEKRSNIGLLQLETAKSSLTNLKLYLNIEEENMYDLVPNGKEKIICKKKEKL